MFWKTTELLQTVCKDFHFFGKHIFMPLVDDKNKLQYFQMQ